MHTKYNKSKENSNTSHNVINTLKPSVDDLRPVIIGVNKF